MGETWLCNHGVINNDRSQCVKCAAAGDSRTPNVTQQELAALRASLAAKEDECRQWLGELDELMKKHEKANMTITAAETEIKALQAAMDDLMRPFPSEDLVDYLNSEMVAVEVEWGAVRKARKLLVKE